MDLAAEKKKDERFDFEKEWENGITVEEARKNTKDFIASLPWKKDQSQKEE